MRVAVLGTGSIGMRHLRVLRALGARPVAVPLRPDRWKDPDLEPYDPAPSLAAAVDAGVTHVVVASTTSRHIEHVLASLDHGCNVLVEKPLAPSLAGMGELLRAAQAAKGAVHVAYCLRFSPSLAVFRQKLGEIGAIHAVRIECQSYLPDWRPNRDYRAGYAARADEGGVVRDLSHEIDYAVWIYGRPTHLRATLTNTGRLGIESEECADVLWRVPATGGDRQGPTISIHLDYLTRVPRRCMAAFGVEGDLVWDGVSGEVRCLRPGSAPQLWKSDAPGDAMYTAQAAAFLSSTRPLELATLDDGVFAVAVSDAVRHPQGEIEIPSV